MNVTEYAKKHNVSKQSVYDRLKRGTLNYRVINGIKDIVVNEEDQGKLETVESDIEKLLKKKLKKSLKKLNKVKQKVELLEQENQGKEKLLKSKEDQILTLEKTLSAFTLIFDRDLIPAPEVIETKIKSKKKNKKKK